MYRVNLTIPLSGRFCICVVAPEKTVMLCYVVM